MYTDQNQQQQERTMSSSNTLSSTAFVTNGGSYPVLQATLVAVPGYEAVGFDTGTVTVFVVDNVTIAYIGSSIGGMDPTVNCTTEDACGTHIYSGNSCVDLQSQGDHLFVPSADVTTDPWLVERYILSTNNITGNVTASFRGIVPLGTDQVTGKPFIVNNQVGVRIGCGLLQPIPVTQTLSSVTEAVREAGSIATTVTGQVTAIPSITTICFFGQAIGLRPALTSYLIDPTYSDCNATNGCGTHVHEGTNCSSSKAQGLHYYNIVQVPEDPWIYVGYTETDLYGRASFFDCVDTGYDDFTSRAFVIHSDDGTRVSCGLLQSGAVEAPSAMPSMAPSIVPIFHQPINPPTATASAACLSYPITGLYNLSAPLMLTLMLIQHMLR